MWYLLLMTLAGSILFAGYLCWDGLCRRFMSQGMRYTALIIVLLTYLIPWVWIKGLYSSLRMPQPQKRLAFLNEVSVNMADIATDSQSYWTMDFWLMILIIAVWAVVAIIKLWNRCDYYLRSRSNMLFIAKRCEQEKLKEEIKELREELHFKRNFEVYQIPGINLSFNIGILRPVIILQNEYDDEDLKLILKHELIHMRRGDLLVNMMLELVNCLHWFNPMIYLLESEINSVCEMSCDERVTEGFDSDECTFYAKVIAKSTEAAKQGMNVGNQFTEEYEDSTGRIFHIMNSDKPRMWQKFIASCVFAVFIFMDSLIAMAYPNVYHVQKTTTEVAELYVAGNNDWAYGSIEGEFDTTVDIIWYDEQFTDQAGTIYPVQLDGLLKECKEHEAIDGQYRIHLKNKEGGCIVETYNSKMCGKCGVIDVGELVSTHTYFSCKH